MKFSLSRKDFALGISASIINLTGSQLMAEANVPQEPRLEGADAVSMQLWKIAGRTFVNASTARIIAEAIILGAFGPKELERQLPLQCELRNGVHFCQGSIRADEDAQERGAVLLKISEFDGQLLSFTFRAKLHSEGSR